MSYPGDPRINAGQWNAPLYYNAGTDLTICKSLWILGIRPDGSLFGGPASIGTGDVWLNNQTMVHPNWAVYMIQEGDLPVPGWYTVQFFGYPSPPNEQLMQSNFIVGPVR